MLYWQYVPITTNVVCTNPVHGEVNSIQHYVIKFIINLRQVSGFLPGTPVASTNKTVCHDIAETLLKVALNNICIYKRVYLMYNALNVVPGNFLMN